MFLDCGGPSWVDWRFSPFGRAKEWRLHAPDGASYHACEILELRRMALDLDYLQVRCRELGQLIAPGSVSFAASDAATLRAAAAIIERTMPRSTSRRAAYLTTIDAGTTALRRGECATVKLPPLSKTDSVSR